MHSRHRLRPHALAGALLILALAAGPAAAVTVFDAASGLPSAQGWTSGQNAVAGSQSVVGGIYTMDTSGAGVDKYGHARFSPITLDGTAGWHAGLSLRVVDETHSSADRAGFSVLFVGSPTSGSIEIAFREDRVFAYAYQGGSFVQGVGAAVDTTDQVHDYSLQVANQQFSLSRDGTTLFSGSLQDYSPQGLPYSVPGFVFFGDNTSSGSAVVEITRFDLLGPVPEPASAALLVAGGLLLWRRSRQQRGHARQLARALPVPGE